MAITDFQRPLANDPYAAWHRAGREVARFWGDVRDLYARAPRRLLLTVAAAAAGITLIGAAMSFAPPAFEIDAPITKPAVKCEQQAWPHLDDTCLRRENARQTSGQVRVISLDRDAPRTVPLPKSAKEAPKASKTTPKGPLGGWSKEQRPPR